MANQTDPAAFPAAWQATYSDHSSQERIQKDAQSIVSFFRKVYIWKHAYVVGGQLEEVKAPSQVLSWDELADLPGAE